MTTVKENSTHRDFDPDTAPDLSGDRWPDHFKADGRGRQTHIDKALRQWVGKHGAA